MADRLASEYQLEVIFEASPYAEARWVTGSEADLSAFSAAYRSAMAEDIDAQPVFLSKSGWETGYVAERYPGIAFARTRERG
jgi:peptide chain release factor 3